MNEPTDRRCVAQKDHSPLRSFADALHRLFLGELCLAPATEQRPDGAWVCAACAARFRRARSDPHSLGSVLAQAQRDAERERS